VHTQHKFYVRFSESRQFGVASKIK